MVFGTGTSRSNTGHPVHCNGQRINLKVDGAFLVSGCVTDLGEESERVSGYYPTQPDGSNRPWRWDRMRENAGRIIHIGSSDDCFIPVEQGRRS